MEQVNKTKKYAVIIVFLLIIVFSLGGYIVYDKFMEKEEESSETVEKNENSEEVNGDITKEEAEKFLNELVSTSVTENLLISDSADNIFINSIRYLSLKKLYTKSDNYYVFKQSDIMDLARKYYMRDSFGYIPNDSNFEYDISNQTFRSELNFGLFSTGPSFEKTRTINNFNFEHGVASLTYQVKITYDAYEFENPADSVTVSNYHIQLIKVNGELRIKSISLV